MFSVHRTPWTVDMDPANGAAFAAGTYSNAVIDALAAARTWPRRFTGAASLAISSPISATREDPARLAEPAAVVARGTRLH